MKHPIAPRATKTSRSSMRLPANAAARLIAQHGPAAMTEAVRHGMEAKRRGDDLGADFWCAVCSSLVRMQQAASPLHV